MESWDPIGVSHAPEAADEYDGYMGKIVRLLQEGAGERELRRYLAGVRREAMGLMPSPLADRRAAKAVCAWWAKTPKVTT
jgi:hypothetical protein